MPAPYPCHAWYSIRDSILLTLEQHFFITPVRSHFMSQVGTLPTVPTLPSEALLCVAGYFARFVHPQDVCMYMSSFLKEFLCPLLTF